MKSWKKVVSKWLLALLIVDSVATPVLALSETTTEGVRIRDTYIKDYKEDASKLSLTIDKEQTNTEQLVVKLKAAEGEINEQGLTLVLQSGLALQQNDQGQDILPEGFYRDEAYNENDRKVAAEGSDALAAGLEQLPVYGEGYYSLKIKPSADRPVTLNTDPNDSSKRFEEHVFVFKKVAEVQTGEMVAMTNEHYLTILKENQLVFTNQETTEITASTEMPRAPGSLTIQLRAYEENNPDPKVPLTESEFEISPVDHPEQTTKGKTDLNGNVTFENIALGTYTIKQLTSTSSYNLAEQIEAVELTESEPAKTVLVINQPKESLSRAVRRTRSVSERAAVNTTLSPSVETYGITYANIDTFGYYQFQDGYSTYGAGMDIRWKLPAEAKEGDYFTLKFGNQILLNRAPMYDDNETVPYDRLDSVEDRYPDTHIGNLFFTVVTRQSATEPTGIPILNVYYTKAGELTFVVQKYANDKGPIEGDAIIGKLVDKYNLTAVTDGNGRHRGSKRIRPAGNGATDSRLDWDINDLDDQIKKYDFYEGFYPNYMLMTEQAGATPTNGNPWFLGRKIIYTSQYMNGTPIDLEDANGDPSKSGVYINQRTQLFETTHDFGAGAQQTSSYGRDALFPVYEDRNYLYHYFVYNGNRNATGPGAWEVYLRPTGSELQIVDIKLFEGYNGQYANSPVTSMVPPMATVDPNNPEAGQQVSTGKRFNPYNATEWMANWGGPEHNKTYLAIIKSKKKTPSAEAADLNRLGYHMGVHSRQSVFATRQIVDYYVPTEGFGAGWVVPKEPKDLLGNFKIQKTDPNKAVVYPNYQKVGDAIQYQDDHGNTYTYNSATQKYVDASGQSLSQKTDAQGNLLFENNLHKVFTQKKNGSTITYTDADGIVYSKKAGEEDIYISPDGKVFRPSRPLLKDYDVTIKVDGTVVTDASGKVYTLVRKTDMSTGTVLEVIDRFGNMLRLLKTSSGLQAWKFANGSWSAAQVTSQGNNYYKLSGLQISTTTIRPKLTETFSFKITDTVTGLSFNHEVDEYGYAIFPSLLVGHTYRLEETSARVGYTRTPKVYLLTVTATGQITITDENGAPISTTTDPLSVVDASNLLYSVVNEVVRLKIKKTDEDGRLIASDKATFKVYKSGDYTKNGNTIQPNAGAVPVATIQTSKVDGTNTLYGESEAVVIPNIMTNVNYGIVEETAPAGYRILTTGIEVKLVQSGSNYVWQLVSGGNNASLESDNLTLKVKNRADLANLVITKKIKGLESLNNLITSSVTFKLTKLNDTSFNPITLRQNANTRFVFNNLSKGVYRLEETEPPTGYVKSPTPYTVIVDKGRASLYQSGQGTTTQATGLTVIKSNHFDNAPLWGDNIEGRALDGNDSTVALYKLANSRLEVGQWWGVDLGAIKNVTHIRYLQGPVTGAGSDNDRMDSLELEYSVDGQNYQSLGTYNAPNGGKLGEVDTDSDVMARYIRVRNLRLKTGVWLAIKGMTITTRNPITPLTDGALAIGNIQNPKIRIEKQDTNGQVISQNVTFKLYKVDDATTVDNVTNAIQENNLIQTFNLQNGSLTTAMDVKVLGKYALVETQAPTGYTGLAAPVLLELYEASQPHNDQLNKAVTRFRVLSQTDKVTVDDSTTATDNTLKMVVKNVRNTFNLKLLKRDLANPNTGLNARFELYNANEATPIGQGDTERDSNSLTFQNLSAGIYVLKEVTPPSGYIQVEPVQLEITQAGQLQILSGDRSLLEIGTSSGNTLQLTVKNDRLKTLRISKRIKGLENLPSLITGQMTFTLTKDNDANAVPDVQTHAANTDFVFNNLTYGSYTLVETAPPAGYMVEPIVYKVAVSRAGVSLYKVANAAPIERVTGATLIKSADLSNIQAGQDGNAIDGRDDTFVTYSNFNGQGDNIPVGAYIGVDLQAVKRVRQIYYLQGNQNNPLDRLNRYTVEYSIDGQNYYPLVSNASGESLTQDTDILARYIRIRNEELVSQKWFAIRELRVSAQEAVSVNVQGMDVYPIGNIENPEFKIEKVDSNNNQISKPVTFKLYKVDDSTTADTVSSVTLNDSNLVQTLTFTGQSSMTRLTATALGKYVLEEAQAPEGYDGLNEPALLELYETTQVYAVTQQKAVTRFRVLSQTNSVSVTDLSAVSGVLTNAISIKVKNTQKSYNFKVIKKDSTTDAGLDARFELYRENGSRVDAGNTTSSGENLVFRNLNPGVYVLKEVRTPSNYNGITDIKVQIAANGTLTVLEGPAELLTTSNADENREIRLTVKNVPFLEMSVQKLKKAIGVSLAGVRLKITALDQTPAPNFKDVTWHQNNYSGVVNSTAKTVEWTTRADGDAVFLLPQGRYRLEEISAPSGYKQLEAFTFTVNASNQIVLGVDAPADLVGTTTKDNRLSIVLKNEFEKKIKVKKIDKTKQTLLAGAKFKLFASDQTTQIGDEKTTNSQGILEFTVTDAGTYYLQESQSPTGYVTNGKKYKLVVAEDGSVTTDNGDDNFAIGDIDATDRSTTITVKNERRSIKVKKRDYHNPATGLNARFELFTEDNRPVVIDGVGMKGTTSNADNSITFSNLPVGIYILKETVVPTGGYRPTTELRDIKFAIQADGSLRLIDFDSNMVTVDVSQGATLETTVKNFKFLEMSVQKLKKATGVSLADVRLKITALDQTPAPNFKDVTWHQNNYSGVVTPTAKTVEWTTRADGDAVFLLPQGRYRLEEISAPSGYKQLEAFTFTVNASNQIVLGDGAPADLVGTTTKDGRLSIVLKNEFEKKIKVKKIDKTKQTLLAGAKFKLFASDQTTQIGDEKTTNSQGILEFTVTDAGTYYLQESQSPTGYVTNGKKYKLVVAEDGSVTTDNGDDNFAIGDIDATDRSTTITVKNERRSIKVKKRDYHNPTTGLNARFELFTEDNRPVVIDGVGMKGTTSNADNSITFSNLPVGIYILKETVVPTGGYRPVSELQDIKFEIQANGTLRLITADTNMVSVDASQGNTIELTIKNFKQFTFKLQKTDSGDENHLLDGARFTIYRDADNNGVEEEVVASGVTTNGVFETPLSFGYYILQETTAPTGYQVNTKKYRFQINHDGTTFLHNGDDTVTLAERADGNNIVLFTMKNTKQTSYFKLAKRDYRDSTQRLEATFELKEANKADAIPIVKQTATTGDDVSFDQLALGKTYILKETVAPEGYQKIEKEFHIDIGADGTITIRDGGDLVSLDDRDPHLIIVKNLRKGEYPQAGGMGAIPYIALGGVMMFVALAVELRRKNII
ncbi:SpaA isopeptide-forming pilin-related protein [Streptococcus suis]|uniref:SpaA isopeptide-forming pilin-related protein n=3 Tax=Streptococcus suis TaxID=1307 RepID=A0A9X4MQJ5_STRSU|nr:SpaA isopeptide-forming pilin-related protein [Streptococcus suis]MDG4516958.1 SpaA isopeptide-forming pilin-related protein [Streptococcus suis]